MQLFDIQKRFRAGGNCWILQSSTYSTVKPCYTGTPLTGKLAITDGLRRFWNNRAKFYWLYRTNSKPDRTRNLKNKKIMYIEN